MLASIGTMTGCIGGPDGSSELQPGARYQPGTEMGIYTPEQHTNYDGRFIVSASQVYHVGTLDDTSPWDHMGDDGSGVQAVDGTIELDVDEQANTCLLYTSPSPRD